MPRPLEEGGGDPFLSIREKLNQFSARAGGVFEISLFSSFIEVSGG